jgi:hypothetical protein
MFSDAHQALEWAYNISGRCIVKMSAINHMRQGSYAPFDDVLNDLSSQEKHAQAAQIIGMVERLGDPAAIQYIGAEFGREFDRDNIGLLVYRGCEALGVGLDKREAVYRVMQGYFVGGVSHKATQRMLGCSNQYVVMIKRCLYDLLDVVHDSSMAQMYVVLEGHGLIEDCALIR